MRFPACEHCVFFVRTASSHNRGKCRRFPPILYYDVQANQPTELWPTVNDNWWCGEFRRPKGAGRAETQ